MNSSTQVSCLVSRMLSQFLMASSMLMAVSAKNSNYADYSMYGMSMQRDWLSNSKTISIKYLGCVWGNVNADNGENQGCMANDSGDGTTSWYQMANCKRAQVAYGMYASTGSTSCKNKDFKESVSFLLWY